ncbi:hypothetical protein [Rugamonas aquatica]|uniref:Uncharacterized protein n=1 Tax=Rugamonas aquatica TaxID=2743357 RepID=A0A6A7N7J1_9BURK|nr:hypothetical protein [Rugamonas aquatica]MQA40707.1 hypothetical protein [Rugamonas aquatica]
MTLSDLKKLATTLDNCLKQDLSLEPDCARILMNLAMTVEERTRHKAQDTLQASMNGLLTALSEGNERMMSSHCKALQESLAALTIFDGADTVWRNLPALTKNYTAEQRSGLREQIKTRLAAAPRLFETASEVVGAPLMRHTLRQVFGMELPPIQNTIRVPTNIVEQAKKIMEQAPSETELTLVTLRQGVHAAKAFVLDANRGIPIELDGGIPLIDYSNWSQVDENTRMIRIGDGVEKLIALCDGNATQAAALSLFAAQTAFSGIVLALAKTCEDAKIVGVPHGVVSPSNGVERFFTQIIKGENGPEIIAHYQQEGGSLAEQDQAGVARLDPSSWFSAKIHLVLSSNSPFSAKVVGEPLFEVKLVKAA